jgi:hypothetical protein
MLKVKTFKNGAYTSFERTPVSGMYLVKVYAPTGHLLDKVMCDDRSEALAFLRCFNGIARGAQPVLTR